MVRGSGRQRGRISIFLVLALASFLLVMNAGPRLLWLPVTAGIACAALAIVRREHGWGFSFLIVALIVGFFFTADHGETTSGLLPPETVKVTEWTWKRVPAGSGPGQIAWTAQLQNTSTQYVEAVRIGLSTFDAAGELVLADFAYATAIPPGEGREVSHLAEAHGSEVNAKINVAEVTGHPW